MFRSFITLACLCALFLVPACSGGDKEQMLRQLEELERMNRAYEPMTNDTLAHQLVEYFDRHGTPNERMRAYYMLGSVYRDLGEAPRALDCYLKASACPDTTAADCDFQTVSKVYSQMGWLFHNQLLLAQELVARRNSLHFAELAGNYRSAIGEKKLMAGAYTLLIRRDSAEMLLKESINLYQRQGLAQDAIKASTMLMFLYIDIPDSLAALKYLIDQYDEKCDAFDERHELQGNKRQFYYYKGRYFESVNKLDSAEYYFRKIYHQGMALTSKNSMYEGLLHVFHKYNQPDSIAKYANLYCEANDSSIALKDRQLTAQLAASYKYSSYQKAALENIEESERRLKIILVLLFVATFGVLMALFFRKRYKAKKKDMANLLVEHAKAVEAYEEKSRQLRLMEADHFRIVGTLKHQLNTSQNKNTNLISEKEAVQSLLDDISHKYEREIQKLEEEISMLRDKINMIEHDTIKPEYRSNSMQFMNMGIGRRIILYAKDRNKQLSENDLHLLVEAANSCFPAMMNDLKSVATISTLGTWVCILVFMNLKSSEITHLLNISSQQIANIKKDINMGLFHDNTAKTLYKNLLSRYKLISE